MLTVKELNDTLETMRGVYKFQDDRTVLQLDRNVRTNEQDMVTVETIDENTGTRVIMSRVKDAQPVRLNEQTRCWEPAE